MDRDEKSPCPEGYRVDPITGRLFDQHGASVLSDDEILRLKRGGAELIFPGRRGDGEQRRF